MTPQQTPEEYVRSVWLDSKYLIHLAEDEYGLILSMYDFLGIWYEDRDKAIQAAFEFTQDWVEEVRKLKEEVKLLEEITEEAENAPIFIRILHHLEAILAEKTRGMREEFLKELK